MNDKDITRLQELVGRFDNASATFSKKNYNNEIDKENDIAEYQKLADEIIQIVKFISAITINKMREE